MPSLQYPDPRATQADKYSRDDPSAALPPATYDIRRTENEASLSRYGIIFPMSFDRRDVHGFSQGTR